MLFRTRGEKIFDWFNIVLLILITIICLLPIWNVLCISFSGSAQVAANMVKLWPVNVTLSSYQYLMKQPQYFQAFLITIERTIGGTAISMIISILTAYPLSKQPREFPQRTGLIWFFFITMLFSGGLIPLYATVYALHMIDTMWVLIIPSALSVWSVVLLLNFIRTLPKEVNESAYIDGAGEWAILLRIIIPLTKPVLATLTLFTAVYHWNSWFDGLVFLNTPSKIPLQTYLQSIVVQIDTTKLKNMSETDLRIYSQVSNLTFQSAQIFVAMVPILCFYPFLQKYFVKGIVMGSVKE